MVSRTDELYVVAEQMYGFEFVVEEFAARPANLRTAAKLRRKCCC